MITNINVGVGARGIVGVSPQPREYAGPVPFSTGGTAKPDVALDGSHAGPAFQYRDTTGEGAVVGPAPARIPRLFYPNIRTGTAGRFAFSTAQTASNLYLPPVAVPYRGGMTSAVRNRNVLRPSASSRFIPSAFVPLGRRA